MSDVAHLFGQTNHYRGPPVARTQRHLPAWKEWWHVCIQTADLTWIGNWSGSQDAFDPQRPLVGRVIGLARDKHGGPWRGGVAQFAPGNWQATAGLLNASWGDRQSIEWRNGQLHVKLQLAGLAADLTLTPVAVPSLSHGIALPADGTIHWLLAPRMLASGTLQLGSTVHILRDVPAYHDHNWGHFAWGDDFAWEWGYALPDDPSTPWSAVSVRLHDRGRTNLWSSALFLWHGSRQIRAFRDAQIQGHAHGLQRVAHAFQVPAALGMTVSPAFDLPEWLELHAVDGADELVLRFVPRDVSRILLPQDDDPLGVTSICEAVGEVTVRGVVHGLDVDLTGHAVYEFMRDA